MHVQAKFTLVGALEGQTVILGNRPFVDGVYTFEGRQDEVEALGRYLAYFQAYPEGSPEIEAMRAQLAAAIEAGETPTPNTTDPKSVKVVTVAEPDPLEIRQAEKDAADAEQSQNQGPAAETVAEAVSMLDKNLNGHWTGQGLPSVDAITALLGRPATRKEIEEAAPGYKRPA